MSGLNDSKQLTIKQKEELYNKLIVHPEIEYKIVSRTNVEIDNQSLGTCLRDCFQELIDWAQADDSIIVDGNRKYSDKRVQSVIKADSKYPCVMAASIIAKHTRDTLMWVEHHSFPQYGWDTNVGYISKAHKEAIKVHGYTKLHRKSYKLKGINA